MTMVYYAIRIRARHYSPNAFIEHALHVEVELGIIKGSSKFNVVDNRAIPQTLTKRQGWKDSLYILYIIMIQRIF